MTQREAGENSNDPRESAALYAELERLREENRRLRDWQRKSSSYIRTKVNQLLQVIGTAPLRPEELDDDTLIDLDPVGIVSEAFIQVLENLRTTNRELALAQEEISAVFHAAGNGVMVLNAQGEVLAYNTRLQELFLEDGESLLGRCCFEKICTPESRREACVFQLVLERGGTVVRRDWTAKGRHYDVVGTPIKDETGAVVQVVLAYNDITDRVHDQLALAEAKARLDTIFDSVMTGIVLVDAENLRIVQVNRMALELIGAPAEVLLGARCVDHLCLHNEGGCPVLEKNACSLTRECDMQRLDGTTVPIYKTVVPVTLEGRQYLLECFIDISDRKQAEAALHQALTATEDARAKMDGILQSVADPLLVTDPEHRIILMNRAAEDLLGLCLYESLGLPLTVVIRDLRLLRALEETLAAEAGGNRVDFVMPNPAGGGEWIFQGRTSVLCDPDGQVTGMISILQNVTRDREIERMKSEFVSTAAHELQTPLAAIIGYAELLLTESGNLPAEVERESLGYIFQKAELLSRIVDDLLDISRIESGRPLELYLERFDLKALIERVAHPYRTRTGPHRFEIQLPAGPLEITADSRRVEEVLDNILSNAFKYSPEGGRVRLRAQDRAAGFLIEVEDQGIGMTAEQQERIFDKFYRGDASNTAIGGTGLGMNIVRAFVEAHGGRVWIESAVGQGTRVSFNLPKGPDSRSAAVPGTHR